jgi:hypothetical protein
MQREGKFVPPRVDVRIHGDVPPELAELAHACTSAEPEDRPTFEEIVPRLDAVLERWVKAAVAPVPRTAARELTGAGQVPRRAGWLWVAAIVVVGLGMGAWAVWPRAQRAENGAEGRAIVPSQALKVVAPAKGGSDSGIGAEGVVDADAPELPEPVADVGLGGAPVEPHEPTSERKPPRLRPFETEECARVREQAMQAVAAYDWPRAIALARRSQCWRSDVQRKRILVQGLFHDNQWGECVRAGGTSKDAEVKRWVEFCRRNAG